MKNVGADRKVLPQGTHMRNMEAQSLSVQKLLPRLSFFKSRSKVRGQGHGMKNFGADRKVLPHGMHMRNMEAQSLSVQKLLPRLSFFKSRSKLEVKVTG